MMDLKNILILIFCVFFIGGCTNNEYILIQEKKSVIQPKVNKLINEKEDMMWAMPSWCENLQQEPFQFKACGIAKSPNLQTSRTRSELDARKQISKILSNQCRSTEKESTRNGNSVFNSTFTCETGEVSIKNALVRKRKTERVGTNFVTFTEMSLSYRFGN